MRKSKTIKTRMAVERRERERECVCVCVRVRVCISNRSLNSPACQKISVRDENIKHKSKNPFKNLAVMLNSFQHLSGKRS